MEAHHARAFRDIPVTELSSAGRLADVDLVGHDLSRKLVLEPVRPIEPEPLEERLVAAFAVGLHPVIRPVDPVMPDLMPKVLRQEHDR